MDESHLLTICSALGGFERDPKTGKERFVPGDEALDCIRDIKRYLKHEEGSRSRQIFLLLCGWRTVENTIIPLVLSDVPRKVKAAALEILVPITWEIDFASNDVPLQLQALVSIKRAFVDTDILQAVFEELVALISVDYKSRSDRDQARIGLLLTLVKNVLAIKVPEAGINSTFDAFYEASLQDYLVRKMHQVKLLDLIHAFCGSLESPEFAEWNIIMLDILFNIFNGTNCERILNPKLQAEPKTTKQATVASSRFNSSFAYSFQDGKEFLSKRTALASVQNVNQALDTGKKEKKKKMTNLDVKRFRDVTDPDCIKSYQYILKGIMGTFNHITRAIKRDIDLDRAYIKDREIQRFMFFCAYFLHARKFIPSEENESTRGFGLVTDFVNIRGFAFVFKKIELFDDDKKWVELRQCLECLLRMIQTLADMNTSSDEVINEFAQNVMSNLFYEEAYIKIFQSICRVKVDSVPFLEIVVENVHVFLSLLSYYCKLKDGLVVRKKVVEDDEEVKVYEKTLSMDRIYSAFVTEPVVEMYMKVLESYATLSQGTIKSIVTMLLRISVKFEQYGFLFRLFNRILDEPPTTPALKELHKFINFVLVKFFEVGRNYPLLLLEMFFHKTRSDVVRVQSGDLTAPIARAVIKKSTYDIEFKDEMSLGDKFGIVLKALTADGMNEGIEYVVACLEECIKSRQQTSDESEWRDYGIVAKSQEVFESFENNRFRLFLSLMAERTLQSAQSYMWVIPTKTPVAQLEKMVQVINTYLADPFDTNGRSVASYFKRKKKEKVVAAKKKKRNPWSDSDEDDDGFIVTTSEEESEPQLTDREETPAALSSSSSEGEGENGADPTKKKRHRTRSSREKRKEVVSLSEGNKVETPALVEPELQEERPINKPKLLSKKGELLRKSTNEAIDVVGEEEKENAREGEPLPIDVPQGGEQENETTIKRKEKEEVEPFKPKKIRIFDSDEE